jgi:alpha-beta hydrolase superfamily lysophospholipase
MNVPRVLTLLLLACTVHAAAAQARQEPITLATATGKIAGTLQLPASGAKVPVALIIAGSGPTDRDGNSAALPGANNSLKLLAQALADAGIASVRYDKRGIAASRAAGAAEADLRFDTYVDDAAAWVKQLKADARFSSVVVIGHSEGALIGMLAAQRARAAGFVSIAGVAQPAAAMLRKQLAGKLPAELAAENERILAALQRGELASNVPPALATLYRPSVQPYMISWFRYAPAEHIAALKIPVLVVQGSTDIQVDVEQAQSLKAAQPAAVLAVVPGMNHVLKTVPADAAQQLASYSDPALPLAPQLVSALVDFVRSVPERRAD